MTTITLTQAQAREAFLHTLCDELGITNREVLKKDVCHFFKTSGMPWEKRIDWNRRNVQTVGDALYHAHTRHLGTTTLLNDPSLITAWVNFINELKAA